MDLYIIRHAWAENRDDSRWPDDDLRPLTAEGKQRFAQVVKQLVARGMAPGIIATSPLVRCVETAQLVAAGLSDAPKIVEARRVAAGQRLGRAAAMDDSTWPKHEEIAWVGHAPDVSRLAAAMIGAGDSLVRFAKGAVAAIRFDGPPALGSGELHWLATAKLLGI